MATQKRLLVIHRALAPYRIDVFNSLSKSYDMDFYVEYEDALEQSFSKEKLYRRKLFPHRVLRKGWGGIANLRLQVISILFRGHYDVVLCSEFNLITVLLFVVSKLLKHRPRIVVLCDDNLTMAQQTVQSSSWQSSFKRRLMRVVDGVVFCDSEALTSYATLLGKGKRDGLCYLPIVQDEKFVRAESLRAFPIAYQLMQSYNLSNSDWVLLFVGRLTKVKNVSTLISLFAEQFSHIPQAKLLVVGNGDLEGELKAEILRLNISHKVILAGKQEGLELYAHYLLGNAFILPSLYEPFGAVVFEALVLGIPVACSRIAGATTLISTEEELFSPSDEREFAEVLNFLYSKRNNPSSAQKGSLNSSRINTTFDQFLAPLYKLLG